MKMNNPAISAVDDFSPLERKIHHEEKSLTKRMADLYFVPKFWERSCTIYEYLGVPYFRKLLMGTIGKMLYLFSSLAEISR